MVNKAKAMGFVPTLAQATRRCLGRYARFGGRASRREFWGFWVVCLIGLVAAAAVDSVLTGGPGSGESGLLPLAFALSVALPQLAAGWRRMHDSGRSGLFLVYPLIVLVGIGNFVGFLGIGATVPAGGDLGGAVGLVLGLAMGVLVLSPLLVLWWLARPGDRQANRFGPPPEF